MSTDISSTLRSTAQSYLTTLSTFDAQALRPLQSENYFHEFAPASTNYGTRTLDQFATHITALKQVLHGFQPEVKNLWVNESLKQVTIWGTAVVIWKDEKVKDNKEWEYKGEYIFVLSMDESGKKVERVLEFLDSKDLERFGALIVKARVNAGLD